MMTQIAQFKVVLNGTDPVVWRRILVAETSSLRTLQFAISDVMGWMYLQPYEFTIAGKKYLNPDNERLAGEENAEGLDDSRFSVGAIVAENPNFEFTYDPLVNWDHQVIFEGFVPAKPKERYPICIAGASATPPEDVGGVYGFEEFKKAINDPKNPRHMETREWYKQIRQGRFDPNYFEVATTNMKIGRRKKLRTAKKGEGSEA